MRRLLFIVIAAMGMFEGHSQTLVQTYTDRCTGEVKVFSVEMGGQTVVAYYNKSRVFTATEFMNGTLQAWLEETYAWWQALSPCSTGNATNNTTQQTTSQATTNATNAANNATSGATSNATGSTGTTGTTGTTNTGSTNTGSTNTNTNGNTGSGSTSSGSGSSSSSSGSSSGSSSSGSSGGDSGGTSSGGSDGSGGDSGSTGNDNSGGGDSGNGGGSDSSGDSGSGGSDDQGGDTGSDNDSGSSDNDNSSGDGDSSDGDSSGEEGGDSGSEGEESNEDSQNEESKDEKSEEKSEESSEEESKEESEEEVEEEESKEEESSEEEEEKEEESSEEGSEEEEEEEEKEKTLAPPIVTANLVTMQMIDGVLTNAASFGYSQSSLTGETTYAANAMVWSNLKQYSINLSQSSVFFNWDKEVPIMILDPDTGEYFKFGSYKDRGTIMMVQSISAGYMRMFSTHIATVGLSNVYLGQKENFWKGFVGGYAMTGMGVFLEGGNVVTTAAFTAFGTKPFNFKKFDRLTVSPMLAYSMTPATYDFESNKITWSSHGTWIVGSNFDFNLTQRFKANIGGTLIGNTMPQMPLSWALTVGSRFQF
jgi:hypothetical protein